MATLRRLAAAAGGLVAVAVLVAGAVLLVLAMRGGEPVEGELSTFRARGVLTPRTHLFGDQVTAEVTLAFDRRAVDPASIELRARFTPYRIAARTREERAEGRAAVIVHRYQLLCADAACLDPFGINRVTPPAARVSFRLRGGEQRSATVRWPMLEAASRLQREEAAERFLTRVWRVRVEPPPASYRLSPDAVGWGLYGAAALLALGGLALFRPELRSALALIPRRGRDPLAGLSPLERALVLVEQAGANGASGELRKALDRLARELRRSGAGDLAGRARRLAWSPSLPGADDIGALAGDVRRTLEGAQA